MCLEDKTERVSNNSKLYWDPTMWVLVGQRDYSRVPTEKQKKIPRNSKPPKTGRLSLEL